MSAWAEQPSGGSPAGARRRPATALPLQRPSAAQADDAASEPETEKLFWTPPKEWMLACMDKGMPLRRRRRAQSCAGLTASPCISSYNIACMEVVYETIATGGQVSQLGSNCGVHLLVIDAHSEAVESEVDYCL